MARAITMGSPVPCTYEPVPAKTAATAVAQPLPYLLEREVNLVLGQPWLRRPGQPPRIRYPFAHLRELLRDPPSYWDVLMITFFSVLARRALRRSVGEDGIVDPVRTYLEAARRPRLTLFHGARCRPDTQIAGLLTEAPEARFVTFPTGRHILWTPIARQGSIEELITGELDSLDSGS